MLKNKESKIIFICWLAYAAAYTGRLNFSASIVAVIDALGADKAQAGFLHTAQVSLQTEYYQRNTTLK